MAVGISIEDFIKASIMAYRQGFDDCLHYLQAAKEAIKDEDLEKSIREALTKQGKIENKW